MTQHTPTPWKATIARMRDDQPAFGFSIMAGAKLASVCSAGVYETNLRIYGLTPTPEDMKPKFYTAEELEANAKFIVRAVNSHDFLIEVCENALKFVTRHYSRIDGQNLKEELETVLAEAKGGQS
jgi:hypothetical protein